MDLINLDLSHLTDPHLSTAKSVIACYKAIKDADLKRTDHAMFWQSLFILAYNFNDVGFTREAIYILENDISAKYYSDAYLGKNLKFAVDARQKAESYKNNPKDKKLLNSCMADAEFVIVFGHMLTFLQDNKFKYQEDFINYASTLLGKSFTIKLKPDIKLV